MKNLSAEPINSLVNFLILKLVLPTTDGFTFDGNRTLPLFPRSVAFIDSCGLNF